MISITSAQNKLFEVDEILLGKRQHYSANFLDKTNGDINVYEALRYIFESYLEWSPTQVRDLLNMDIIHLMRMEAFINRVPCPPELERSRDFEYVAWFLYPETRNCNDRDLVVKVYQRLLAGEISRFPKGFFDGTYRGWFRARVAFQHMLIEFLQFQDLDELYSFFASPDGKAAM